MSTISLALVCSVFMLFQFKQFEAKTDFNQHFHHQEIQQRVILALDKVLEYILENNKDINIDGLFGVVFVQAHLNDILHKNPPNLDISSIKNLKNKADIIYALIKPNLYQGNFKQVTFVEEILDPNLWQHPIYFTSGRLQTLDFNSHDHTFESYLNYLSSSNMSESQSDQCLLELIQTGSKDFFHECRISNVCQWHMVDDPKYDPTYGITHRLLYLQIALTRKCTMDPNWYQTKTNSYCSYILWEARKNQDFGFVDELDDILFEQITLCGFEGYAEFFQKEFIEHVLDAQTEHGCFSIPTLTNANSETAYNREKRSANLIKYGCNDHTTGLGASTLAIMLRYLGSQSQMI